MLDEEFVTPLVELPPCLQTGRGLKVKDLAVIPRATRRRGWGGASYRELSLPDWTR